MFINPARVIVQIIRTVHPINAKAERRVHIKAKHDDIRLQEAAKHQSFLSAQLILYDAVNNKTFISRVPDHHGMISRVGHHSPAHLRQAFAAHHYSWRTYLIVELGSCGNIAGLLRRRSDGLFFLLFYALGASQLLQDGLVEPPIQLFLFFNML